MNKRLSQKKYLALHWQIVLVFGVAWSWLLVLDVGRVSNSTVLGYGTLLAVYALLVLASALVVSFFVNLNLFNLHNGKWRTIVTTIVCWAALELLLAKCLVLFFWGSGSSWDDMMPVGSLTPLIMATPLRFLTRFFGFFGTSALVGAGIILLFHIRKQAFMAIAFWFAIFSLTAISFFAYRDANGLQLNATIVSEQLANPKPVDAGHTEFVLLPEYGLDYYTSSSVQTRFMNTTAEVYFSGTRLAVNEVGSQNILVHGSSRQGYIYEQAKSRLIVGGEFMPYPFEAILKLTAPVIYDDFNLQRLIVKGREPLRTFKFKEYFTIANAPCSSIMNPEDYRTLTNEGATILANSASLEIFRGSRLFGLYHDGWAKFMATANARPFLQSSNNWKAFALDHNGNTAATVQLTGTKDVTVHTNKRKTPYTYLGEWVAVLGGLYIVKELVWSNKDKLKKVIRKILFKP